MAEQLTEEQFQTKVMGASEPVLVDFFCHLVRSMQDDGARAR